MGMFVSGPQCSATCTHPPSTTTLCARMHPCVDLLVVGIARPATIFFEYPTHLGMKRQEPSRIVKLKAASAPSFRCYWERKVVKDAFLRAGFKRTKGNTWQALWDKHLPREQLEALAACQKVEMR